MIYTNQEELDAALVEWQGVLRLRDWTLSAEIVRAKNMMLDNVDGAVTWHIYSKTAEIELLDPTDYADEPNVPMDHEVTLVHELLHLHYAGFDRTAKGTSEHMLLEQSIEAISRSLVELKRAKDVEVAGVTQPTTLFKTHTALIVSGSTWKNNKNGKPYTAVGCGHNSETKDLEIEYTDDEGKRWHRPVYLFLEKFTEVVPDEKEAAASETKG